MTGAAGAAGSHDRGRRGETGAGSAPAVERSWSSSAVNSGRVGRGPHRRRPGAGAGSPLLEQTAQRQVEGVRGFARSAARRGRPGAGELGGVRALGEAEEALGGRDPRVLGGGGEPPGQPVDGAGNAVRVPAHGRCPSRMRLRCRQAGRGGGRSRRASGTSRATSNRSLAKKPRTPPVPDLLGAHDARVAGRPRRVRAARRASRSSPSSSKVVVTAHLSDGLDGGQAPRSRRSRGPGAGGTCRAAAAAAAGAAVRRRAARVSRRCSRQR